MLCCDGKSVIRATMEFTRAVNNLTLLSNRLAPLLARDACIESRESVVSLPVMSDSSNTRGISYNNPMPMSQRVPVSHAAKTAPQVIAPDPSKLLSISSINPGEFSHCMPLPHVQIAALQLTESTKR